MKGRVYMRWDGIGGIVYMLLIAVIVIILIKYLLIPILQGM